MRRLAPGRQADPIPRGAAAPQPARRQPERAGTETGDARRSRAGAPHALLRGLRHQLRHRRVARQRDGARGVQARRDQRRHRWRHRCPRNRRGECSLGNYRLVVPEFKLPATAPNEVVDGHASAGPGRRAVGAGRAERQLHRYRLRDAGRRRPGPREAAKTASEAARPELNRRRPVWRRRCWSWPPRRSLRASRRPARSQRDPRPDDGLARQRHQARGGRRRGLGAHGDRQGRSQDRRAQGRRPRAGGGARVRHDGPDASGSRAPRSGRAGRSPPR